MHPLSSQAPARLHHLDALRAAAMLLGLALHAMLAYAGISWVPQDRVSSEFLGVAFAAIHGFRMPLFFLLSGFFTGLLWQRHSMRPLLRQRAARIALPLGLALFTVLPLNWAAMWWASSGDAPRWLLAQAQTMDPVVGMMVFPFFGHLWFLWFLCWLTLAFALLAPVVQRWAVGLRLPSGRPSQVRDVLLATPLALLWLVPLTALMAVPMYGFGMQPGFGPETSAGILPMPHVLGYFAVFFGFGALCAAVPQAMQGLGRRWWLTLPAACLIFPLALGLSVHAAELASWVPDPQVRRVAALLGQSAYAWLASLGAIGLCGALITRERPMVRWLADASYWMYLAHLPLVIALQTLLLAVALGPIAKFAAVLAATTAILLLAYRWVVRGSWVGRMLNGPR
ncbi:MAG: acyltransferase family protein [Rhodoferax sp.]|nr:acyltransferase family protein [Rhodoferax sp.]